LAGFNRHCLGGFNRHCLGRFDRHCFGQLRPRCFGRLHQHHLGWFSWRHLGRRFLRSERHPLLDSRAAKTEAAPAARAAPLTSAGTPPVAAARQMALGRKLGEYLAQRHAARLQLLGQRHDVWPSLTMRPAAPAFTCCGLMRDVMRPFPADLMRIWPISTRVNKPENDAPQIIEPVGLASDAAYNGRRERHARTSTHRVSSRLRRARCWSR